MEIHESWWEDADRMVVVADRVMVVEGTKESEIAHAVAARLDSGQYALPVLPTTLVRVIELSNRAEVDLKEVSECIRRDPVVAGEVLSLVNSAAYAPASPIKDLHRAVVHVGGRRVRSLMVAVAARLTVFRSTDTARAQQLWAHSLATAVFGRAIARAASADPEEAFLAGLLHDVGKTVILGLVTEEERAHPGLRIPEMFIQDLSDQCHTGAGARVATSWGLGADLVAAIEHHHGLRPHSKPLVAITALANDVCASLGVGVPRRKTDLGHHLAFSILSMETHAGQKLLSLLPAVLEEAPEFRGVTRVSRLRPGPVPENGSGGGGAGILG